MTGRDRQWPRYLLWVWVISWPAVAQDAEPGLGSETVQADQLPHHGETDPDDVVPLGIGIDEGNTPAIDSVASSNESILAQPLDGMMDDLAVEQVEQNDDFFGRLTAEQEADIIDRAFPLLAAKWPFNKVFVCWETISEEHFDDRSLVRQAVEETWAAVSGLEFLGWGQCTDQSQGIRIAVSDQGPHVKFLGKFLDGVENGMVLNFSYLNWGQGCRQQRDYCIRVIAVHEFGHAIGFAHEQNRPDTPGECDMRQGSDGDTTSLTPWDPSSVMNYCNPVYANNGLLSEFDILAVKYIYGDV